MYPSILFCTRVVLYAHTVPWRPIANTFLEQILKIYEAFAFSFLTSANQPFWGHSLKQVARSLDLQALSRAVIHAFAHQPIYRKPRNDLLWLLAHFIALNRASPTSQGTFYLQALYQQLSILAADIRSRSATQHNAEDSSEEDEEAPDSEGPLPSYITGQLEFLVHEDGINELLSRFTSYVGPPSLFPLLRRLYPMLIVAVLRHHPHACQKMPTCWPDIRCFCCDVSLAMAMISKCACLEATLRQKT
jgi:hypothetical protein